MTEEIEKYVREEEPKYPKELKDNPFLYIRKYYDSIYPIIGNKVFSVLALVIASGIMPKIHRKGKEIKNKINIMVIAPPGCMPKDSKVLMSNGEFKNIEDIKVGDRIISPQKDGSNLFSNVVNINKWESNKNYNILDKKNDKLLYKCSDNHNIPYYDSIYKKHRWYIKKDKADYLNNLTKESIRRKRCFSSFPIKEFENRKNCKIEPYCLGAYLGDGCFSYLNKNKLNKKGKIRNLLYRALSITSSNFEILEEISKYYPIMSIYNKKDTSAKQYRFSIYGDFSRLLQKYKLNGKGSGEKFIPKEALYSDIIYRKRLLAGLIDTDGYYDKKGVYYITTKSKRLSENLLNLIFSLGCRANVRKVKKTIKRIGFEGEYYEVSAYLRDLDLPILVNHKKNIKRKYWQNHSNTFTIKLEEYGKDTVYGFELDSPSHNFITDNWMVTGNSGKSAISDSLEKIAINPISSNKVTSARLYFELKKMDGELVTLIIEDVAIVFSDEQLLKLLENALGEESSIGRHTMKNTKTEMKKEKIDICAYLSGTPENISNKNIREGMLMRTFPLIIFYSEEEHEKIIDFIADSMGKEEDGDLSEYIKNYYQELYDIQKGNNSQIAPIEGYIFSKEITDEIKIFMKESVKFMFKKYRIANFRETEEIYRIMCASAFLNIFNRNIINNKLEIIKEDLEIAKKLVKKELQNKRIILECIDAIDFYGIKTRNQLIEWEDRLKKVKPISNERRMIMDGLVKK